MEKKSLDTLSLYDISADDLRIYAKPCRNHPNSVVISVEDENLLPLCEEKTHLYAWESLVYFAKQIIAEDNKLQDYLCRVEYDD